jgi:hypothetical protein
MLLLVLVSLPALADIPPRDTHGCVEKKVGDACQTDEKQDGHCATSECVGRDYSQGMPPKPKKYECLRCATAAAEKAEVAVVDAGSAPAPAPAPTPAPAPAKKSGCNSVPVELAPLALVLLARWRRS